MSISLLSRTRIKRTGVNIENVDDQGYFIGMMELDDCKPGYFSQQYHYYYKKLWRF